MADCNKHQYPNFATLVAILVQALIYSLSAYVQLNDNDAEFWFILYLVMCVSTISLLKPPAFYPMILLVIVPIMCSAIQKAGEFYKLPIEDWIAIEAVREAGGMVVALIFTLLALLAQAYPHLQLCLVVFVAFEISTWVIYVHAVKSGNLAVGEAHCVGMI
jgi:Transmembrane family 220, helix